MLVATFMLGTALVLPLAGAGTSDAAPTAGGRISAHLTDTSFPAAQAGTVKVVYRFSSLSRRFAFTLARKSGTTWVRVRHVDRQGTFRGTHSMTVKSLFGTKPIRVAPYRLRLSSAANTVTLRFTITKPPARPRAGPWTSTSLSGPVSGYGGGGYVKVTHISFTVTPDQAKVAGWGFAYEYSGTPRPGQSCSGNGFSAITQATSPITGGRFTSPSPTGAWSGPGSGPFQGTFDSATTAHGTAQLSVFVTGPGCFISSTPQTGTFTWKATRAG